MAAGVAYAADEEVVVLQGGALEAVDVLLFRSSQHRYVVFCAVYMIWMESRVCSCGSGRFVVFGLVLGMQNDCPAGRENVVVSVKLVRLKVKPAERGRNGERLAVWQMNDRRSHGVCERTTRVFSSQRGQQSSLARYSSQCLLLLSLMYHADRADIDVGS